MTAASRAVVVQGFRQGSGVIINGRLVLTAAHLVARERRPLPDDEPSAPARFSIREHVTVAHPEAGSFPCTISWIDHAQDVALLRTETDVLVTSPLRSGRPANDQPLPGCQIIGFPAVQRERRRDMLAGRGRLRVDQFTGTILPAAGRPEPILTFAFDRPPAEPPPAGSGPGGDSTLLAGLSGAPIFAGEVLLGIVTRVPRNRFQMRAEGVAFMELSNLPHHVSHLSHGLPTWEPVTPHTVTDPPYEAEYAKAVETGYRRTKVFGLDDLDRREAEWDLDVAYLSLEAETGRPGTGQRRDGLPVYPDTAPTGIDLPRHHLHGPQRIDTLLSARPRILLRGDAGAGKTTLVWWLAAHAATGTLGPQLAELNGLVPFVVPLRTVRAHNGAFPSPAELPHVARLVVDRAPEGWAGRVLTAGRALLLVDGLDEVPQADREDAYEWLAALLRRYPGTRCLVTVRPLAVAPDWLAAEGFEELRLLPLRDEDIRSFVASWHRAAALDGDDPDHLHELQRDLMRQFQQNHTLRDLARTPLLCAVICALHRKRQGFLPDTRFSLYQSALNMLLGHRDVRRKVGTPDGIRMSVEEHHQILQRFAVWLVRCGQSEFTRAEAWPQLESALSGMARVRGQGSADDVFTHLLNRTGLLQERSANTFQFIHRTFQDFLAAKELVDGGYVGELVRNAAEEQWRDVLLLAAGHGTRRDLHALLTGLLDRADKRRTSSEVRTELRVLAARCAEHAPWLDKAVADRVRQAVGKLVPPIRFEDVRRLASLGASVLPLLPPPEQLSGAEFVFTAGVICEIGGAEALPYARSFTAEQSRQQQSFSHRLSTFARSWDNFPTAEYARHVLSRLDLSDTMLPVNSAQQLAQLHHLPFCKAVSIRGNHSSAQLEMISPPPMRRLRLQGNTALADLSFLPTWVNRQRDSAPGKPLTTLEVSTCPGLRNLSALVSLPLDTFELDCRYLPASALGPLREIPGLRAMKLACAAPRLGDLPAHQEVQSLSLSLYEDIDLGGLDRWTALTRFTVSGRVSSILSALDRLRDLPQITEFSMPASVLRLLSDHQPPVTHLTSLALEGVDDRVRLSAIPHVFPSLTSLRLGIPPLAPGLLDLSPLRAMTDLGNIHLDGFTNGVKVQGATKHPNGTVSLH